jgi:inorganic pyrophosphatase/exopolyphosphatase
MMGLEVGSFVDIGGVVDHHCLDVGSFVDISGVVDHHRLNFLVIKE